MANIKIIDDDREYAENISLMLKKDGHTVSMLDTTEGAVEELSKDTPDLLILDVMFPEKPSAGFELAREIRKHDELANLRIIMLTGINQEFPMDFSADDINPAWLPVQDFLEKPVTARKLLEKVSKLLDGGA